MPQIQAINRVRPYLSNVTIVELSIDDAPAFDVARPTELLDARTVGAGPPRRDPRPFEPDHRNCRTGDRRCPMAPSACVHADVLTQGGHAAEAAQHLREVLDVGSAA